MTERGPEPNELSPQLQIVYRDAIDNIMFLKREQWIITNYLIVALAGIYALISSLTNINFIEKAAATIVVVLAVIYFFRLLKEIWIGIDRFRERIAWFNNNCLSASLLTELGLSPEPKPPETDKAFRGCIKSVGVFGAMLVIYAMWREQLPVLITCVG